MLKLFFFDGTERIPARIISEAMFYEYAVINTRTHVISSRIFLRMFVIRPADRPCQSSSSAKDALLTATALLMAYLLLLWREVFSLCLRRTSDHNFIINVKFFVSICVKAWSRGVW